MVLADRHIPGMKIDFVTTNNKDGAYELTSYLIKQGHRRIAITLSLLFSTERQRLEGYQQALKDHHISIDPSIIFTNQDPFSEEKYHTYARIILKQIESFTAIFSGRGAEMSRRDIFARREPEIAATLRLTTKQIVARPEAKTKCQCLFEDILLPNNIISVKNYFVF